jgi:plastocyanin
MKRFSGFQSGRVLGIALVVVGLLAGLLWQVEAQPEQQIVVTIKDFAFRTTQMPLQLHMPTVIHIKNEDNIRHDFGSDIFQDTYTQIEGPGVISYGSGIDGVFLEPGGQVDIRFTITRSGRYRFQCSIHPDMKGEIFLLSVGAV